MKEQIPARIHLLPAKDSPYVLVIRRKPSKCFHIIRWNTETDHLEHGSWFHGKLYPKRCDISFDGKWMVYLAMGANGETWNGICQLPFLKTVAEGDNMGAWFGGGFWASKQKLLLNQWQPKKGSVPFHLHPLKTEFGGEDLGVLYPKWERDGWKRIGENYGTERQVENSSSFTVLCEGDDGWVNRPSPKHPSLIAKYIGYMTYGYTFRFSLEGSNREEHSQVVDEKVDSACWDQLGNLLLSREGILYRYTLADLASGQPTAVHDLESLEPPQKG